MAGKSASGELLLSVTIHDTPAALRFGGDGWMVTFAGTEADKHEAAKLMLFNKQELELVVRLKDHGSTDEGGGEAEAGQSDEEPNKGRPWLRKGRGAKRT